MSLKQKIDDNAKLLYNVIVDFRASNQSHFPSGLVAHTNSEVILVADVLRFLDEAIIFIIDHLQKEAFAQFCKNPNKHDRYWAGQVDAFTKVLAVLEGA